MAARELFESGVHDLISTNSDEEDKCWIDTRDIDIWKDVSCMKLFLKGIAQDAIDPKECKRARKRILNYHWKDQSLYFKRLFVPRLEDRMGLVIQMHKHLGDFGEERTLAEI